MGWLTFCAQRRQWPGPPWRPEKLCLQLLEPLPDVAHHPTHANIIIIIIIILNAEWHCHACLAGKLLDLASADPCCTHVQCAAARRSATGEPYQDCEDLFCRSVTESCSRPSQGINTVAASGQLHAISDLLSVYMLCMVSWNLTQSRHHDITVANSLLLLDVCRLDIE